MSPRHGVLRVHACNMSTYACDLHARASNLCDAASAILNAPRILVGTQEEVMEFVNSIAHIVHTSVAMHGGAANKNIGDAFLLVRGRCSALHKTT